MKLNIEINDETLKNAIRQQLDAAVAKQVGAQIDAVVDGVLNTKLERFTDEVLAARIEMAAKNMLLQGLGRDDWTRTAAIKNAIDRAAVRLVNERLAK